MNKTSQRGRSYPGEPNYAHGGDRHGSGRSHSVRVPPSSEEAAPVGEPRATGEGPAKSPASQAAKGKGRGRGRARHQHQLQNQGSSGGSGLEATVKALARLTLRQGDYIARLQTDHTVLMTFNIEQNPANIIPALAGVAERWNYLRLNEPGKINRTLRHTLLIFVIDTLLKRLADKDSLQNAAKQGWLVSPSAPRADAQWAYMMWKETKPRTASRGQGAVHSGLGGVSDFASGTRADPALFSDSSAHRGDVGTLSDAAARIVASGVPDHANDAEVVRSRGMADDRGRPA